MGPCVVLGVPHPLTAPSAGDGWLHKAVVLGSSLHIIEEVQVFQDPQPVETLVVSHRQVRGGYGAGGGTGHPMCGATLRAGPFHPRGACMWGLLVESCRCPWPPAPDTAPAMTASSPGIPTAPGMAGPVVTQPAGTGRGSADGVAVGPAAGPRAEPQCLTAQGWCRMCRVAMWDAGVALGVVSHQRITEWLGWKGTPKPIQFQPLPWGVGRSGHPQRSGAACARASPPSSDEFPSDICPPRLSAVEEPHGAAWG